MNRSDLEAKLPEMVAGGRLPGIILKTFSRR